MKSIVTTWVMDSGTKEEYRRMNSLGKMPKRATGLQRTSDMLELAWGAKPGQQDRTSLSSNVQGRTRKEDN